MALHMHGYRLHVCTTQCTTVMGITWVNNKLLCIIMYAHIMYAHYTGVTSVYNMCITWYNYACYAHYTGILGPSCA